MKTILLILVFIISSCGFLPHANQSSELKETPEPTVTLFTVNTSGDVTYGDSKAQREFAEKIGGAGNFFDAVIDMTITFFSNKYESKDTQEVATGAPVSSKNGCMTVESCSSRSDTKSKHARRHGHYTKSESSYQDIVQAEDSLNKQLDESGAAFWEVNQIISQNAANLQQTLNSSAQSHNKAVTNVNIPTSDLEALANGYTAGEFKTLADSKNGQKVRDVSRSIAIGRGYLNRLPASEQATRKQVFSFAEGSVEVADGYYFEGNEASGDYALDIARQSLDIALGFVPVVGWAKDLQESITGFNFVTGQMLTPLERSFAVLGVFSLGYGSKVQSLGKVGKIFERIGRKVVSNAGDFNSAISTANKIANEATKLGFTSKGIKVYSKIRNTAASLPPKLRIKRVKEGTDPGKIAIIGRSMGNDSGLVGVNDVRSILRLMELKSMLLNLQN